MKTSSFEIMKDSWIFLWNHKKIAVAMSVFGLVAAAIFFTLAFAIGAIVWISVGTDRILTSFHDVSVGILPHMTPWVAIVSLAALFMTILLVMFYPRICSAYYVLHALRKNDVGIRRTLREGLSLTLGAWSIIFGLALVPVLLSGLVAIALIMQLFIGFIAMAFVGFLTIWFYIATYFIEQLVADGSIDFMATLATSWNYVKRCWWQIMGIVFFLWLTNVLISLVLTPFAFMFVGFILAAWYAIASNKIYLIVRSESEYKYSSE